MITRIDPPDYGNLSVIQVDSDQSDPWAALQEIESWALDHGYVTTNDLLPRQVLIAGRLQYRMVCYRISDEERAAIGLAQRRMDERADRLRGVVEYSSGTVE